MNKILIIGQAPAQQSQSLPYDTTMLYDWLKEIGISKQDAQGLFGFEAVYSSFPGFDGNGGHLKPSIEQMDKHWDDTLQLKVEMADKIWVLGNVARDYIDSKPKTWSCNMDWLYTIHPSNRNFDRFNKNRAAILKSINNFLPQQHENLQR